MQPQRAVVVAQGVIPPTLVPGGYFSIYWVEGLTQEQLDAGPGTPPTKSEVPFGQDGYKLWHEEVRGVKLCSGECPQPANRCVLTYDGIEPYTPPDDAFTTTCWGRYGCPAGTVSDLEGPEDESGYFMASDASSAPVVVARDAEADAGLSESDAPVSTVAGSAERRVLGELRIRRMKGATMSDLAEAVVHADAPAPDRLIGQVSPLGAIQWLHVDHLGSTRIVTDEAGAVVSEHKYWPFGEEIATADPLAPNTHKFTGHERDEGTGLDYMMARYYDATQGRFISPDPLAGHVDRPQTLNRYIYAGNNPVLFIDPDGLDFFLKCSGKDTKTCQDGKKGKMIKNKDGTETFEATVVKKGKDGGLEDGDGNKYTATVDSTGLHIKNETTKEISTGTWQKGSQPVTFTQESGALAGFKFTFNEDPHFGQDVRGTYTHNLSYGDAKDALGEAGFKQIHGFQEGIDFKSKDPSNTRDVVHFGLQQGGAGTLHTGESRGFRHAGEALVNFTENMTGAHLGGRR